MVVNHSKKHGLNSDNDHIKENLDMVGFDITADNFIGSFDGPAVDARGIDYETATGWKRIAEISSSVAYGRIRIWWTEETTYDLGFIDFSYSLTERDKSDLDLKIWGSSAGGSTLHLNYVRIVCDPIVTSNKAYIEVNYYNPSPINQVKFYSYLYDSFNTDMLTWTPGSIPAGYWDYQMSTDLTLNIKGDDDVTNIFAIDKNANVGFGTTTPSDRMHLTNGDFFLKNTSGIYGLDSEDAYLEVPYIYSNKGDMGVYTSSGSGLHAIYSWYSGDSNSNWISASNKDNGQFYFGRDWDCATSPVFTIDNTTNYMTIYDPLTLGAYTLPNTDGTANQYLQTDGAGNVAWTDLSAQQVNKSFYMDRFNLTSGTATAGIGLDPTTQRIYTEFTRGNTSSRTFATYLRESAWDDMAGFQTNPIRFWVRSNSTTFNTLTFTIYINGVADATVNALPFTITATNTWEQKTFTPGSVISPGDYVNFEIDGDLATNGQTIDICDFEVYYTSNPF